MSISRSSARKHRENRSMHAVFRKGEVVAQSSQVVPDAISSNDPSVKKNDGANFVQDPRTTPNSLVAPTKPRTCGDGTLELRKQEGARAPEHVRTQVRGAQCPVQTARV